MTNLSDFKSYIRPATETPINLKQQFLRLRYDCGIKGDPICFDHKNKLDIDRFDEMDTTIYIITTEKVNSKEHVITGARIMPTIIDYEFEAPIWHDRIGNYPLPKSPDIYSGGRWVNRYIVNHQGWSVDGNDKAKGFIANGLMLMNFYRACEARGVKTIIGWPSTRIVRFGERNTMTKRYPGQLKSKGGDGRDICFAEYDVNEELYNMGLKSFKQGADMLETAEA